MQYQSKDLRHLNIDIVGEGFVKLDQSWNCDDARNYFTRLYLITDGSGYLHSKTEDIQMLPGNIYLIPSEYDFRFGCTSLEKVFFHILLPSAEKTDLLSEINRILVLPACQPIIDQLRQLHNARDTAALLKTKMLVYSILNRFIDQYHLDFSDNRQLSLLVEDALAYIWKNISVKLCVRDIAAHLYISESKLRNLFRSEVGVPLGAYIDDAVFFTVRKMLFNGYSIEHISTTLEFCDRNYLSRRFKERFGKTISQYRQELSI